MHRSTSAGDSAEELIEFDQYTFNKHHQLGQITVSNFSLNSSCNSTYTNVCEEHHTTGPDDIIEYVPPPETCNIGDILSTMYASLMPSLSYIDSSKEFLMTYCEFYPGNPQK